MLPSCLLSCHSPFEAWRLFATPTLPEGGMATPSGSRRLVGPRLERVAPTVRRLLSQDMLPQDMLLFGPDQRSSTPIIKVASSERLRVVPANMLDSSGAFGRVAAPSPDLG